jgi:hypothetical protein
MGSDKSTKDDHTVMVILITAIVVAILLWLLWGNQTPAAGTTTQTAPDYPGLTAPDITSPMYSVAPATAGGNDGSSVPLPPWSNSPDSVTPSCGCASQSVETYYGSPSNQAVAVAPVATAASVAISNIINNYGGDDTPTTSPLQSGPDRADPVLQFLQSYNPSSYDG